MDKIELINLINSLKLPIKEYCVVSGGSLLMHGIREKTNDLDIAVTETGFKLLKDKFSPILINEERKQYKITDDIECFIEEKLDEDIDIIEGYPCQSLNSVYKFKKMLNRDKDQKDIINIEKFLKI